MQTMKKAKKLALVAMLAFATALCVAVPAAFAEEEANVEFSSLGLSASGTVVADTNYDLGSNHSFCLSDEADRLVFKDGDQVTASFWFDSADTCKYYMHDASITVDGATINYKNVVAVAGTKAFAFDWAIPIMVPFTPQGTGYADIDLNQSRHAEGVASDNYLEVIEYDGNTKPTAIYYLNQFGLLSSDLTPIIPTAATCRLNDATDYANINGLVQYTFSDTAAPSTYNIFMCNYYNGKYVDMADFDHYYSYGMQEDRRVIYMLDTNVQKFKFYNSDLSLTATLDAPANVTDFTTEPFPSSFPGGLIVLKCNTTTGSCLKVGYVDAYNFFQVSFPEDSGSEPSTTVAVGSKPDSAINGLNMVVSDTPSTLSAAKRSQIEANFHQQGHLLHSYLSIHFENSSGTEVPISGSEVIKVSSVLDSSTLDLAASGELKVISINSDLSYDVLPTTLANGVVTFETTHFSDFALVILGFEDRHDMYRMYNPNSGEHFYTMNAAERDYLDELGWDYEGVGWISPSDGDPVYRLYNPNAGEHHYTLSIAERNMLIEAGWNDEGIGWYSDRYHSVPLYREYNPNAFSCNHNYTANYSEHKMLVELGWNDEGIGWYGVN